MSERITRKDVERALVAHQTAVDSLCEALGAPPVPRLSLETGSKLNGISWTLCYGKGRRRAIGMTAAEAERALIERTDALADLYLHWRETKPRS